MVANNEMDLGTTWVVFFTLTATINGQNQDFLYTTYLDAAMTGFNPFCVNAFKNPDPGRRAMLFQPLTIPVVTATSDVIAKQFIHGAEETKCVPVLTIDTVPNYIDFLDFASTKNHQLSSDADYRTPSLRYDNYAACEAKKHPRDNDMLNFFNNTGGEIILAFATCITHTITIIPFEPPTFTRAFETALIALYEAALDPDSETSEKSFADFVWSYGTHFSKQTHLGAQVIFGRMFPRSGGTADEEMTRSQCVLEAAREALAPCRRWCNESTRTRFARASAERCGETEHGVLAAFTGPLPEGDLEDWASVAEEYPDPIFHYLEPISTLFTREWSSSHDRTGHINKKTLDQFFKRKVASYTTGTLTGGFQQPPLIGCGINSRCQLGTECFNEPDTESGYRCAPKKVGSSSPRTQATCSPPPTTAGPFLPGGIIIVGGSPTSAANSLALFTSAPPLFPFKVHSNTLSLVGSVLYNCGGDGNNAMVCRYIDTKTQSAWQSFDIPWRLENHRAVVINDEIWFFLQSKLYIHHTTNPANKFRDIDLGFSFGLHSGAVTHGSKTFVIGAGNRRNEVYINTDPNKPAQWELYAELHQGRYEFGCLIFGTEIFVTGGDDLTDTRLSSVEAINILNGTVRTLSPLVGVRGLHQMAIIHGRPAVLGGWNATDRLATIDTYDEVNNAWEILDYKLSEPRSSFGLTQYLP